MAVVTESNNGLKVVKTSARFHLLPARAGALLLRTVEICALRS